MLGTGCPPTDQRGMPRGEPCTAGAVEMPCFVLGKTPVDAWRTTLRKHLAPFAELATRKIILIVPSSAR